MRGFIAQLVEHRTGIAGSNPVEALTFFRLLLPNCLNWKINCGDQIILHFHLQPQFKDHLFQHTENENKSHKRWVGLACEHRGVLVGYLKLFRFMNVMMRKQNANWTALSYCSNYSIFRAKKLETTSTTKKQQNLKNRKVRFRLNIDVKKEMEDSRPYAVRQLPIYVRKIPTEF